MTLALILALATTGLLALFVRRSGVQVELPRHPPASADAQLQARIVRVLAGEGCGACGYSSCEDYAAVIAEGSERSDCCLLGGPDCARSIEQILRESQGAPAAWAARSTPAASPARVARIA